MSNGRALFRVRSDAQARVKAQMQEILIHKNDVDGYEYNAAVTLIKQINLLIKHHLFEESADGMVGLGSATPNTLIGNQSNAAIKKSKSKKQSIAEAEASISKDNIVAPKITTNSDAQYEADRQNTERLATIGVK